MLDGLKNRSRGPGPKALENGILLVGDEQFRRLCAIHKDGNIVVAHGYEFDDDLILERRKLERNEHIPKAISIRSVALEEIAALYGRDALPSNISGGNIDVATAASRKLLTLIKDAARSRASDIKIFQHDEKTIIRVRIAGKAQNFGTPWTPEEGLTALTYAFDARDGGGGHTTMQSMGLQSFSISPKPSFPLPDNVVKLRGQKGYHESSVHMGQHMVLRLFYSDDDPVAGDLDDLGFDPEVYEALRMERQSDQGCVIVGGVCQFQQPPRLL